MRGSVTTEIETSFEKSDKSNIGFVSEFDKTIESDISEIKRTISRIGYLYKKIFGNRILGEDDISEKNLHDFVEEAIMILKEFVPSPYIGEEFAHMWEDGISIIKVNLSNGKIGISLTRLQMMILELNEISGDKDEVDLSGKSIFWKWIIKKSRFDYAGNFFDIERFNQLLPKNVDDLERLISFYNNCFSLKDVEERGSDFPSSETLYWTRWGMKDIWKTIGDEFFSIENKQKEKSYLKRYDESRGKMQRVKYITYVGQLAKRYFLEKLLENGIISLGYYEYLKITKGGWETLKELYYVYKRGEKADELLQNNKNIPEKIILQIRKAAAKALEEEPKISYRLLRNLETVSEKLDELLGYANGFGLELKGVDEIGIAVQSDIDKLYLSTIKL